ncbi:MAG: hypothetical protein OEZ01_09350, partial [Candidatus Heimdallarchaeota archaeon]|nr:hypothetical protein [Candidatus Heimdallarchaeota archaeon]
QVYLILTSSILTFIGYISLTIGLERGNASVGGVLLSSRVLFSIPLAIIIIGEIYNFMVYISILIAIIGSISVSWKKSMRLIDLILLRSKGIRWFILTSISWSVSNMIIRQLEQSVPVLEFLFYRQIVFVILIIITFLSIKNKLHTKLTLNKNLLLKYSIYSAFLLFAQFLYIYALGFSLTITESIGIMEGAFTLLFSILIAKYYNNQILNEPIDRESILIRIVGMIFASIGTLGVVIYS